MDDLVKQLRTGVRRLDRKPADNNAAERELAREAADRIEADAKLIAELEEVYGDCAMRSNLHLSHLTEAKTRIAELEAALRPLAALPIGDATPDDVPLYGLDGFYITHGDIRRAAALGEKKDG